MTSYKKQKTELFLVKKCFWILSDGKTDWERVVRSLSKSKRFKDKSGICYKAYSEESAVFTSRDFIKQQT